MESPQYLWIQLFRICVLIFYVYVAWYFRNLDFSKAADPKVLAMQTFSNRYFTGWNMIFQMLYLMLSLSNFFVQNYVKTAGQATKERLDRCQGYLFTSLVTPSTAFVLTMFWTLWLIDRELVLPRTADEIIPMWLNHAMHSFIVVPLAVELLFTKQKLPSHKWAIAGLTVLCFVYSCVLMYTYFETGRWIYHVFGVLTWPQRALFNLSYYIGVLIYYYIGYMFQEIRWGKRSIKLFRTNDEESSAQSVDAVP